MTPRPRPPPTNPVHAAAVPGAGVDAFVFFDFFRRMTAPASSSFLPSTFWDGSLLRLAHSEPAVWHAASCLGALHWRWTADRISQGADGGGGGDLSGRRRAASMHYGRALALAGGMTSPAHLLALSVALVAASHLLGLWKDAQTHILAGLRLSQLESRNRSSDVGAITRMLARMDMQSLTFIDSTAPYPHAQMMQLPGSNAEALDNDNGFIDYDFAASELFRLIKRCMLLESSGIHLASIEEHDKLASAFVRDLHHWEEAVARLERNATVGDLVKSTPAVAVRFYHTWLRLLATGTVSESETQWDGFLGYFERLVVLAEVVLQNSPDASRLSLDPGLVVPLFSTVHRCRHAALRRRALGLLRNLHCQDGMWESEAAATAAGEIIRVEEEGLLSPTSPDRYWGEKVEWGGSSSRAAEEAISLPWACWQIPGSSLGGRETWPDGERIPGSARVQEVRVLSNFDQRRCDLTLMIGCGDDFRSVDLTVSY